MLMPCIKTVQRPSFIYAVLAVESNVAGTIVVVMGILVVVLLIFLQAEVMTNYGRFFNLIEEV